MKLRFGLAGLVLLVACGSAFADAGIRCDDRRIDLDVIDAYDPAIEATRRQEAIKALEARASSCPDSTYSLGQLYRHGSELPGNLVQKDVARARELILAAAENGRIFAYADLAEMALKEGQGREAMKWTQVYLYLLTHYSGRFDRGSGSFDRSGYNAELLARATVAGEDAKPRLTRKLIRTDLADYLRDRESAVAANLQTEDETSESDPVQLRVKRVKGSCFANPSNFVTGYAVYLLEVQPSGAVTRTVLGNFSPAPGIDAALRRCLDVYEFESFAGNEPIVSRIPIVFGYRNRSQLKLSGK